jgi:hypothetical protein
MKKIKLTRNKFALVDDADYEWLNQWKWQCGNNGYASRRDWLEGRRKGKNILMHILINSTPQGMDTDHINHNKLDNQRKNLRSLTHQQNAFNIKVIKNTKSRHKGISWNKETKKWMAHITLNYKFIFLGRFSELRDAIFARKEAEKIYFV